MIKVFLIGGNIMKYAFYCPHCKSFWQSDSKSDATIEPCLNCGKQPIFTGCSAEEWKQLDQAAKTAVCSSLEVYAAESENVIKSPASGSSIWIHMLRIMSWLSFAGIVIVSIVIAGFQLEQRPGIAFLIVVGGVIVGLFTIAFIMMLIDMASDLRKIRNQTAN